MALDCTKLDYATQRAVAELPALLDQKRTRMEGLAETIWGDGWAAGKIPSATQVKKLGQEVVDAKALLRKDYLRCLFSQEPANKLRKTVVRCVLVGYQQDPAGWEKAWSDVWPDVTPEGKTNFWRETGEKAARVESDLAAVKAMVKAVKKTLEESNIALAKKQLPEVKDMLKDAGPTTSVHAALKNAKCPTGVEKSKWELLGKGARALSDMRPKLETLANKPLPQFIASELVETPVVEDAGVVSSALEWVKAHPIVTVVAAGGVGYVVWRIVASGRSVG